MASQSKKPKLCETLKLNQSDRISRLPDSILQDILCFLPMEEAASLSTVSKTWFRVWNSLRVFQFHFDQSLFNGLQDEEGTRKFVTWVNNSLFFSLTDHKEIIESFYLKMNLSEEGLVSQIDNGISQVMKNYVREIDIRISNILYSLPQATFASTCLVKLHLECVKFPDILFTDKVEFKFLKELSLVKVVADENQVHKLLDCSRFIEKLTLKMCPLVKVLILQDFFKLDYLEVNVRILQVEAPNLHTLILYGPWQVLAHKCVNIRIFRCLILTWDPNACLSVQELISKLPLLETLQLFLLHNHKMRIRSCRLQNLLLFEGQRFEHPMEVELETPLLSSLYFSGTSVPSIIVMDSSKNQNQIIHLNHFGYPSAGLDGFRVHQLGNFSKYFSNPIIDINLHQISTEDLLTLAQLQEHPVLFHPPNVRMLVLHCIPVSPDYTSFLNCLLWSCHPMSLVVVMTTEETLSSDHKHAFIEFLCRELLDREENPTCCRGFHISKCWRHYIEDVNVLTYRSLHEFENPILLPASHSDNVFYVDTTKKGEAVEFRFEWSPFPVFPG